MKPQSPDERGRPADLKNRKGEEEEEERLEGSWKRAFRGTRDRHATGSVCDSGSTVGRKSKDKIKSCVENAVAVFFPLAATSQIGNVVAPASGRVLVDHAFAIPNYVQGSRCEKRERTTLTAEK